MSALVAATDGESGWLLADSVAYMPGDGKIVGLEAKAAPVAHRELVVAYRGIPVLAVITQLVGAAVEGLDVLAEKLPEALSGVLPMLQLPTELRDLPRWVAPDASDRDSLCQAWLKDTRTVNMAGDMLDVMQGQRECIDPAEGAIGGHAVMTTIAGGAITQSVLHKWDDRIGERMNMQSTIPGWQPARPRSSGILLGAQRMPDEIRRMIAGAS
jgi:hypothetical protein